MSGGLVRGLSLVLKPFSETYGGRVWIEQTEHIWHNLDKSLGRSGSPWYDSTGNTSEYPLKVVHGVILYLRVSGRPQRNTRRTGSVLFVTLVPSLTFSTPSSRRTFVVRSYESVVVRLLEVFEEIRISSPRACKTRVMYECEHLYWLLGFPKELF